MSAADERYVELKRLICLQQGLDSALNGGRLRETNAQTYHEDHERHHARFPFPAFE